MDSKVILRSEDLYSIAGYLEDYLDTAEAKERFSNPFNEDLKTEISGLIASLRVISEGMCHDDGICGNGSTTWFEHGV